jgi:hypothetical protein
MLNKALEAMLLAHDIPHPNNGESFGFLAEYLNILDICYS